MSALVWLAAGAGAVAVAWALPGGRDEVVRRRTTSAPPRVREAGVEERPVVVHAVLSAVVGAVVWWVVPGLMGFVGALAAGGGAWWWTGQESVRRDRAAQAREAADLPHLVGLVAVGVRTGAPVEVAVAQAARALPGATADLLGDAVRRLQWGEDPVQVWGRVAERPGTAPLGRALARASRTGAGVVDVVEGLADELADRTRTGREDRARSVGVRAAVPLGVCLLPAFLLLGIVPLVAGLVSRMSW